MIRSDEGSVCYGDGWPTHLWNAFISKLEALADGSVAEKLHSFLNSELLNSDEIVTLWRERVRAGEIVHPQKRLSIDTYWLPVPATFISWSPGASFHRTMTEALASKEATLRKPDLAKQAKYYLECTLLRLHGVTFGPDDYIEDRAYAVTRNVREIQESFEKLERQRIADPKLGLLDRFGF